MSYENELYHHGILGMKWGVRRYQNSDGSLTSVGKKRYGTKENFEMIQQAKANVRTQKELDRINRKTDRTKSNAKSVKNMSNEEIQDAIYRLKLERELSSLRPKDISAGKKLIENVEDVAVPAIKTAARNQLGKLLDRKLEKALGNVVKDPLKELQKTADMTNLKRRIAEDNDVIDSIKTGRRRAGEELAREAKDYTNRRTIDAGQRYFKEGPYAETSSGSSNNSNESSNSNNTSERSSNSSNIHITRGPRVNSFRRNANPDIVGEGTSTYSRNRSPVYDAEEGKDYVNVMQYPSIRVNSVNSQTVNSGRDYVQNLLSTNNGNQLLLEDKSGR